MSLTVPVVSTLAFLFTVLGGWYLEGKVIGKGAPLPLFVSARLTDGRYRGRRCAVPGGYRSVRPQQVLDTCTCVESVAEFCTRLPLYGLSLEYIYFFQKRRPAPEDTPKQIKLFPRTRLLKTIRFPAPPRSVMIHGQLPPSSLPRAQPPPHAPQAGVLGGPAAEHLVRRGQLGVDVLISDGGELLLPTVSGRSGPRTRPLTARRLASQAWSWGCRAACGRRPCRIWAR